MSLFKLKKSAVVAAVQESEVFMMPCNMNPYTNPADRKYINPAACLTRHAVNRMALDFKVYACLDQATGLHPLFYSHPYGECE